MADEVKRARGKKAAALNLRITQGTRDTLAEAAAREGRSMSEVAERWLSDAADGAATYTSRIGGSGVAEAMEAAVAFAQLVEREIGDPRTFLPARDALQAGWRRIVDRALPFTPDTPEGAFFHELRTRVVDHCAAALEAVLDDQTLWAEARRAYLISSPWGPPRESEFNALATYMTRPQSMDLVTVLRGCLSPEKHKIDDLRRFLAEAELPASITELMAPVRAILPGYAAAEDAYMTPRKAALRKAEELVARVLVN